MCECIRLPAPETRTGKVSRYALYSSGTVKKKKRGGGKELWFSCNAFPGLDLNNSLVCMLCYATHVVRKRGEGGQRGRRGVHKMEVLMYAPSHM